MISEAECKIAREKFERAAREFDFIFHSPFHLTDTLSVFGYIESYGSQNGTVICLDYASDLSTDPDVAAWCKEMECFCSFMSIEPLLGVYKSSYFRAMLRDWGKY